jgi:hypothetical protein
MTDRHCPICSAALIQRDPLALGAPLTLACPAGNHFSVEWAGRRATVTVGAFKFHYYEDDRRAQKTLESLIKGAVEIYKRKHA